MSFSSNLTQAKGEATRKVAAKYGIETSWYAKLLDARTPREKYHDGWWFQFYIYKDLEYKFERSHDTASLLKLHHAYYSGNWKEML